MAGADPSGAYGRPSALNRLKRFGPPGLYGSAAVERTEPLTFQAGGLDEPQGPQSTHSGENNGGEQQLSLIHI